MKVTVLRGSLDTVGSVIEIPYSVGPLGVGPVYEVDPVTRKCKSTLQLFEITEIIEGQPQLKPVPRT